MYKDVAFCPTRLAIQRFLIYLRSFVKAEDTIFPTTGLTRGLL